MRSEPELIAKLVQSQGHVQEAPLQTALNTLAGAVQNQGQSPPRGAVIDRVGQTLEADSVWRRFLLAFDRARSALETSHFRNFTDILHAKSLPGGITIVSSSVEPDVRFDGHEIEIKALHQFIQHPSDVSRPVLLLMSGTQLAKSMKLSHIKALSDLGNDSVRVLLLVDPDSNSQASAITVSTQERLADAGDDDNPVHDEPTLAWRQAFMRDVPTWTADQIAEQAGYQAKNKSAAASRWSKLGEIFSVPHGGKQYYPQFQFKHGEPRPIIARILKALGEDTTSWDRAFFFATPNGYLDDARPLDRLNDKNVEKLLVQLAERHANAADIF
jgi:hypothetical protein